MYRLTWRLPLAGLVAFSHLQFSQIRGRQPYSIVRKIPYLIIGPMKAQGHLGRCYLRGRAGDAANVILSATGYNLRLVLAWLRMILRVVLLALLQIFAIRPAVKPAS